MKKVVAILLLMVASAWAAPMSSREIELLLRGGTASAEIERDVQARKLASPLTEEESGKLKSAGASPELLKALSSPAAQLTSSEAAALTEQQQKQSEQQKLSASSKLWVYGQVWPQSDGGVVVTCMNFIPAKKMSEERRASSPVHFAKMPPTFTHSASGQPMVNCEVAVVGSYTKDPSKPSFPDVVLLNDLGSVAEGRPGAQPAEKLEAKKTKKYEMTVPLGKWVAALPVGGKNESVYLSEVNSDFIMVAVELKTKAHRIPVKNGPDNGRDNITLLAKADDGRELYFVNTPRAHAGEAILLVIEPVES